MLKRLVIYSLPEGTDPEEFWKYHAEVHSADVKKHAGPGLKKYVINRVTKVLAGDEKIFGIVELYFENEKAMNESIKNLDTAKAKSINEEFWSQAIRNFTAIVEEKQIL